MPEELFGLTERQVMRLRTLLNTFEAGDLGPPAHQQARRPQGKSLELFGILESAVSATTALTGPPKTGTLSVYKMTSTGGTTDTGIDETVYNFAAVSCTTDRWTFCSRDSPSGIWKIYYQACT